MLFGILERCAKFLRITWGEKKVKNPLAHLKRIGYNKIVRKGQSMKRFYSGRVKRKIILGSYPSDSRFNSCGRDQVWAALCQGYPAPCRWCA